MTARTEASSILNLGWFNEGYLPLARSNSVTFLDRTIALLDDAVIDWLIKWVQFTPAVDHSPALNRPCLPAWTQLTYFLSFSTSPVFPLHFAMSRIFISLNVQNAKGSVNIFRVTLVYWCHVALMAWDAEVLKTKILMSHYWQATVLDLSLVVVSFFYRKSKFRSIS